MSSTNRFGFEWDKYHFLEANYEQQFCNWLWPLDPEFFRDKKVLDAGCGMGRNSFWPLKWGASEVVAFDFDERSVAAARKNLSGFKNSKVLFKSIYDIDWQDEFNIIICIGVIHHLKDPRVAIEKLMNALKPGGTLAVWVYSFEGNEWIKKYVNPVRINITSKLSLPVVHFLSYFCSVPLWLFVKIFKGPSGYLKQLAGFKFWHIHSIVFDQLIPEIANYWSQAEVAGLFDGFGAREISIQPPPNGSGWTIILKK